MDKIFDILNYESGKSISGLTNELSVFCVINKYRNTNGNILVVTNSVYEANNFYKMITNYTNNVSIFPMDDFITSVAIAISPEFKASRLDVLNHNFKHQIIVTNLMGYLRFLPSIKSYKENLIDLKKGIEINRNELIENLEVLGYKRESLVTSTGEYAVRGFVLDIFVMGNSNPVRIVFFDNEIESIKEFDTETQLTTAVLDELSITPFSEQFSNENSSLYDYIDPEWTFFIDKPQIDAAYKKLQLDITEFFERKNENYHKLMFNFEDIKYKKYNNLDKFNYSTDDVDLNAKEISNYYGNLDNLKTDVDKLLLGGKQIYFCTKNKDLKSSLIDLFDSKVSIIPIEINKGFIFDKYAIFSTNDVYGKNDEKIVYKNTYHFGKKVKYANQLEVGDYVVHIGYGICQYVGIVSLSKNGLIKDYLQLNFAGNDKIYVPVENINNLYKYGDADGTAPKLNHLNSTLWTKTKATIRKKINDISEKLIKLYKERANTTGESYRDLPEEEIFASEFIYELTKDQMKAIDDINQDLRNKKPMDRLLCGDVGFGKTEVAFRAMFKTVYNGAQVLYLCPTTILSKQQYESAISRFVNFPVEIALVNRFTTQKEYKKILEGLESGKIDIVIGTHRLLNDEIKLKKLGLLIIDEEQRFGVTHKEKIKEVKTNVNVLTLSATPIPRTMKMALSGVRDMSIIDTPPVDRYPIQTYVIEDNDLLVKDAIYKELSRNGQVFILYNSVEHIMSRANLIKKLVPDARICVAHGQMNKIELEDIMEDFIDYKYDVLICTTIIETGIDIPNANTLIVYDADKFGLSQLYQLRGRVGRTNRIAYTYLLYKPGKLLTESATKRLEAIKEYTELGSGYRIAMKDLSIRGAGDLIGSEQAGFIDSVGISLYTKLISESLSGNETDLLENTKEGNNLINVETHISDDYVSDDDIKIEIHQLINTVVSSQTFNNVKAELENRFGKLPQELEIYMYEEWFDSMAKSCNITRVLQNERLIEITLPKNMSQSIKGDTLFIEAMQISQNFKFKYVNECIVIQFFIKKDDKHFLYYLVPLLEKIV
ncbi:MAG: transcription-repair coupling factor [Bacilli bacterium]|nr:transcription-repair coupling factor [Bacilli bacterium]